jgi:hypothetical protein
MRVVIETCIKNPGGRTRIRVTAMGKTHLGRVELKTKREWILRGSAPQENTSSMLHQGASPARRARAEVRAI